MVTTIEQYPLHRNKIMKKFLGSMLSWIIFSMLICVVLALMFQFQFVSVVLLFFGLLILFAAWQWFYENKYFDAYFYNVDNDFLIIKKGWITPREIVLPYEKLQDVYMDQDILDRIFGLWDVHVSTATMMSGASAHIDGVNGENANKIRNLLLEKVRGKQKRVTGYD